MKKNVRTYRILLLTAAWAVLAASGCSARSTATEEAAAEDTAAAQSVSSYSGDMAGWQSAEAAAVEAAAEETGMSDGKGADTNISAENPDYEGRKLIRNVDASVETMEFDRFLAALNEEIARLDGYVERSEVDGNSYRYESSRWAYYTIRIPANALDNFLNIVGELGNITYRAESVEDITLQYVDTESRVEALEVEQERLLALLAQAESVEDMITIEYRLSEVRYELESYASQLRTYDNQVDYSTVYLNIQEVERETAISGQSAWDRMRDGFAENLYRVGRGIQNFGIGVVMDLPYIAVCAVILLLLYFFGKIIYYKILERGMSPLERRAAKRQRTAVRRQRREERKTLRKEKKAKADQKIQNSTSGTEDAGREKQRGSREDGEREGERKVGVCGADRQAERGEIHVDESSDRTEDCDHVQ